MLVVARGGRCRLLCDDAIGAALAAGTSQRAGLDFCSRNYLIQGGIVIVELRLLWGQLVGKSVCEKLHCRPRGSGNVYGKEPVDAEPNC